ncbi:20 kDa protein having G-X-X-X-Q-X-W motif-containing protein [Flagelloscypha sp. PMI_526]|nr:20 kDa protein having G-X-X-X-Q-X-W motif-containing protein [Flagelloscypha sp. PMI_526]
MFFNTLYISALAIVLPGVLAAPRPTPVHVARAGAPTGMPIHPNGDNSKCLDVVNGNFANGAAVDIYDCNDTNAQKWYIHPGSTQVVLAGTSYCLDAGENPGNNTPMKIWQCSSALPQQRWYFTDDNRIALEGKGLCLDLTWGNKDNGNTIETYQCIDGNQNQAWTYTPWGGN